MKKKVNTDNFLKMGNGLFYMDIDELFNSINPTNTVDLSKMELLKFLIECVVTNHTIIDDDTLGMQKADIDLGFKLVFNTLLYNNIIKEVEYE